MSKLFTAKLIYFPRKFTPANFPIAVGHPFNVMLPASSAECLKPVECELATAVNLAYSNHQFHLLTKDGRILSDEDHEQMIKLMLPFGKNPYELALDTWLAAGMVTDPGPKPVEKDFEVAKPLPALPPTIAPAVSLESLETPQIIPGPDGGPVNLKSGGKK